MTKAALKGDEKDDRIYGTRGDFVEIDSTGRALPTVRIDGPYGAPTEDVFNVEVAVLVGAGIGTPCRSMLNFSSLTGAFRCHSVCVYSQAHLVPPEEGHPQVPQSC